LNLAAFQSALADVVAGRDGDAQWPDLSTAELERLEDVAAQPGMRAIRMLYQSWRLTKILTLLPMTVASLGDQTAAALLRKFWLQRPALGPYFVEECIAFLDFLEGEGVTADGALADVVVFERARLELHSDITAGAASASRAVVLDHDPVDLLAAVARKNLDAASPSTEPIAVLGEVTEIGHELWTITSGDRSGTVLDLGERR